MDYQDRNVRSLVSGYNYATCGATKVLADDYQAGQQKRLLAKNVEDYPTI